MIQPTVDAVEFDSPPTATPETPVAEAARSLRHPDVSALPVLADGNLVGIVTASDVVAMVAETEARPTVAAIASTPVRTTSPGTSLSAAAETMRTAGVRHLPVVADGEYRGLLSAETLAPYLSRHALDVEWEDDPLRVAPTETGGVTAGD